jgi:hypothetical protein
MSLQDTKPTKLTIISVDGDGPKIPVTAQFNPKEIGIDKSVPWNKHKNPKGDIPMLEFTNAENRNMTFELFFDATEPKSEPVEVRIAKLHKMTLIRTDSQEPSKQHPPRVIVTWGFGQVFKGVIESLSVKYTMFSSAGTPLRATCSLKIKEVDEAQKLPATTSSP